MENTIARLYEIFCTSKGVQTDSRKVSEGEIFFALRGENFDGNRYAAAALEAGAVAAVVDNEEVAVDERYVVVDDTLVALQELARCHRRNLSARVLAITGTNGKTTTKELVSAVLSRGFRVRHTQGNLNNHIGVPLTLLSMPADTEIAVVEMGASAQGEIALLASIAEPDLGLITNIGRAHLEGFGGAEGIRKGKGELYDRLAASGGVAIFRNDDPVLSAMVTEREGLSSVGYESDIAAGVRSNLVGDYNLFNIAAALAVGDYFGVPREEAEAAIAAYQPSNNRSQALPTAHNLLTVDCYNANPSSMAASIANHADSVQPDYLHKVLILGDMLELGEWSSEEHRRVLKGAMEEPSVEMVITVGNCFAEAAAEMCCDSAKVSCFANVEEAALWLGETPLKGAFVLVKGSRGIGLERLLGLL